MKGAVKILASFLVAGSLCVAALSIAAYFSPELFPQTPWTLQIKALGNVLFRAIQILFVIALFLLTMSLLIGFFLHWRERSQLNEGIDALYSFFRNAERKRQPYVQILANKDISLQSPVKKNDRKRWVLAKEYLEVAKSLNLMPETVIPIFTDDQGIDVVFDVTFLEPVNSEISDIWSEVENQRRHIYPYRDPCPILHEVMDKKLNEDVTCYRFKKAKIEGRKAPVAVGWP